MKSSQAYLISVLAGLVLANFSFAAPSTSSNDDSHLKESTQGNTSSSGSKSRVQEDKVINKDTASLGDKLFYPYTDGQFKHYYEELKIDKRNLVDALNEVKPKREADRLTETSVDDEIDSARHIAEMMMPLTTTSWKSGWDEVEKRFSKLENGTADTQYAALVRRLDVAFNNWGTDSKSKKDIVNEPEDKNMKSFFEAWKIARKEVEERIEKFNDNLKLAGEEGNNNLEAKKKLWGDPSKASNDPANALAVGKDANAYIAQLVKQGDTDRAYELAKGLAHWDNGHFNLAYNSTNNVAQNFTFGKNDIAAMNAFKDPQLAHAAFVGHPHPTGTGVQDTYWDTKGKALAVRVAPAGPNASGGANGAYAGVAPGLQPQQNAELASVGSLDGGALFKQSCFGCHGGPGARRGVPSSGGAAQRMQVDMPMGGPRLSPAEQAAIVRYLDSAGSLAAAR